MPKLIDHAAREVQLTEAAWAVVRDQGIQGLSVRSVAAEAGVAVGSLRRSFPTQQSLLISCIRLVTSRVSARIRSLPADLPAPAFAEQALAQTLPLDAERHAEMQVWLALSIGSLSDPGLRAECDDVHAALAGLCRRVLERLRDAGELRADADVPQCARRIHALVDGLALHLVKQPEGAETTWALDALRDALGRLAAR